MWWPRLFGLLGLRTPRNLPRPPVRSGAPAAAGRGPKQAVWTVRPRMMKLKKIGACGGLRELLSVFKSAPAAGSGSDCMKKPAPAAGFEDDTCDKHLSLPPPPPCPPLRAGGQGAVRCAPPPAVGLCLHSMASTHSTSDIHSLGFARFGAFAGVRSWGVIEAWAHSPNVASSRCSLGGMEPFREGHRSRGYLFPVPLLPLSLGAAGGSVGAIEDFGGGPNRGRDSPYRGAPPKILNFLQWAEVFFVA